MLEFPAEPDTHLQQLTGLLDDAYREVAAGLSGNAALQVRDGRIGVDRLTAVPPQAGLEAVRGEIARSLPRVGFPELLLEVFARAGVVDEFTHISGAQTRMDELEISLCSETNARCPARRVLIA